MTLLEARVKNKLSQAELADKAEITQTQLSFIERGMAIPHPSTRIKLEQALGIKVDWFATRVEGPLTRAGSLGRIGTDTSESVIESIGIYIKRKNIKQERKLTKKSLV